MKILIIIVITLVMSILLLLEGFYIGKLQTMDYYESLPKRAIERYEPGIVPVFAENSLVDVLISERDFKYIHINFTLDVKNECDPNKEIMYFLDSLSSGQEKYYSLLLDY